MPADLNEPVFVGVDTHADAHHVAVVDSLGRHLGDREFPADPAGYRDLLDWIRPFGGVQAVGVEGNGAYGAQVARVLTAAGLSVVEVNRPDRANRRANGKSDPLDAYAAAEAVASGRATAAPKSRDGIVESISCLRVARRSAVKAKTQCINQIRGMLVTGPAELREQMRPSPSYTSSPHGRPGHEPRGPLTSVRGWKSKVIKSLLTRSRSPRRAPSKAVVLKSTVSCFSRRRSPRW